MKNFLTFIAFISTSLFANCADNQLIPPITKQDGKEFNLNFQDTNIDPNIQLEFYLLYSNFKYHEECLKMLWNKVIWIEGKLERCCPECP